MPDDDPKASAVLGGAPTPRINSILGWLGAVTLLCSVSACLNDDDGGTGGADTGLNVCIECEAPKVAFACYCTNDGETLPGECAVDAVEVTCPANCEVIPASAVCDSQVADTSPTWNPGSYISYNTSQGVYEIDETFFDDLVANTQQLLYDRSRVDWQDPYYKFVTVDSGDFFQELGFQTGDYLISISGYSLADAHDAGKAALALLGNSSWSVVIYRPGTGYVTLYYTLV